MGYGKVFKKPYFKVRATVRVGSVRGASELGFDRQSFVWDVSPLHHRLGGGVLGRVGRVT